MGRASGLVHRKLNLDLNRKRDRYDDARPDTLTSKGITSPSAHDSNNSLLRLNELKLLSPVILQDSFHLSFHMTFAPAVRYINTCRPENIALAISSSTTAFEYLMPPGNRANVAAAYF